jgi:homoserine dehydrogenase
MIEKSSAHVICELSFTDLKTGEPAVSHCRRAIAAGKSVVTSNKGPAVLALAELRKLASEKGVHFFYEGTVMSGTPVINLMEFCLAGNEINEIKGILNGTTNYILTRMHEGMAYDEALEKAQELGYAEADPTGDVEGFDAMAKVVILANCLMDADLTPEQVDRKGISGITKADIESAEAGNRRWKLISHLIREGGSIKASVKPMALPADDPLSSINGATNALTYSTDLMGDVTVIGAGAGRIETGFSILIDLLRLHSMRG